MTALGRLAPRTLIPTGEGAGGHTRLEPCDVAYALAGLPPGAAALLRAMYAGDTGSGNLRDAYLWAWQEAARIAVDHNWQVPKGVTLLRILSARAVDELVYPQLTLCPRCAGSKSVQPNQHNPSGDCRQCRSTGRHIPTDGEMASLAGITAQTWRLTWAQRYVRIYGRLLEWNATGLRHVRERLREDGQRNHPC